MDLSLKSRVICLFLIVCIKQGFTQQYPPRFDTLPPILQFPENTAVNTSLKTIIARGNNGPITISGFNSYTNNKVYIVQNSTCGSTCVTTATLYLKTTMDRETESAWSLNIVATDDQHTNLKTVATILIFITDVNDEDPVFVNKLYQITLPEDTTKTAVLTVHASDRDNGVGGLVNYTLKGTGQSTGLYDHAFSINSSSGVVTREKRLDYSKLSFYQYLIIATDGGGRTGNASLIIKVQDIQNKPPYFTGLPYNIAVDENTAIGTVLGLHIRADDGDIGDPHDVEYSFQSGECINLFEIDNKSGNVTIKNAIDRDEGVVLHENGVCTLTLMAKETLRGNERANIKDITSNTTVVIAINDKDDNRPMFGQTSYNTCVYENVRQVPLTIIGTAINVTDTDQGNNSLVVIEVQDVNGTVVTNLKPVPGVIQGSGYISLYVQKPFDYEEVQHVNYKVIAREKHNNSTYVDVQIHVEIIDRNDNAPQFLNDSFIVSIFENTLAEQTVLMETATDKDSGDYGKIEYSLRGGGSQFVVDKTTGVITKQGNVLLDREKRDEYVLTLMAKDGGGNLQTVEVTVKLKDVNDNPPIFSQSSYIGFIKENNSRFDQNVTVSASDRDQNNTNNSKVEFNLESSLDNIEDNFTISTVKQSDLSYNGLISLKTPLDFETLNQSINGKIKLYVKAVDFGNPPLNTTCVVEIIVQDINDNTPYFNSSIYTASILEDATPGTNVTTVYAHDNDGTPVNKEINFYIDKGGNDHFRIDGKSGVITVDNNAEFDRESVPLYNLTILATDRGTPARTGKTTVIVIIDDVNDSPPTFTESNFKKTVYENVANDSFVSNCSAEDLDENSDLKYKIVGVEAKAGGKNVNETVKNYFEINTNTGIVTVKSSLDREVADEITLVLTVEDLNAVKCPKCPKQTATASLQVTLLDVNDNSPVFQQRPYHVNVTEGKISGAVITVKATDKDLKSHITYMITKNYYDTFKIDSSTGIITRDQTKDIDRETCQTIVIEILANDTVHNGTTTVNMTILDVNDNTPTFQKHTSIVYLLENNGTDPSLCYNNTIIAELNATDRDEGPNAELTYHLINSDKKFQIDPLTGVITAHGHFDREVVGGKEYTLTITVNDNDIDVNKRRTSTTTLIVHINDTNDNPPSFRNNYTFPIREDVKPGSYVDTVSAVDSDFNQSIRYFIDHENSDDKYLFKIEESSGVIETNGSLVDKFGWYNLRVNATDDDGLTGYTSVQIIVTDINNNAPQFQHLNSTYYVYECAVIGSFVTTLVATDADSGANKNMSYYFVNQTLMEDSYEDFKLDSITGEIKTVNNLSVEVHRVYNIRVGVQDHGNPVLSSTADITIQVIDVNNHPPKFKLAIENATVMENTDNVTIKTVKAIDQDVGSILSYSIEKGNYSDNFRINNYTGRITIIKSLDREKITMVKLKIKAVDISGQSVTCQCYESVLTQENSTTMNLYVYIQDQNDHKPQFKDSYLSKGVRRTVNKGVTIFDLKDHVGLDPDVGINAIHQFELNGEFTYSNTTKLEQQIKNLPTIEKCSGKKLRKPICLTGNGTVLTNIHFEENMNGYIDIPVLVKDAAGNSTAVLRLYIISDYQTAAILLGGNKAFVESIQDALMGHLTQKLGLNFTSDGIRAVETGGADPFKSTYLDFHVVDPRTQRILSAREAIDLFDQHSSVLSQLLKIYRIFDVVPYAETKSKSSEQGIKTTYIMTGVIALLGVIVLLVGFFYCKSISRYQRKLKAATTKSSVDKDTDLKASHPGTNIYARNQNPLLNKEEDFSKVDYDRYDNDDLSVTSCDSNQFKKKEPKRGEEEKGATMDMYHEEINMQGEIDALAMVLQQHRQEKAASHESLVPSETQNGHVQSNDLTASFINEGYELHLETTEV